MRMIVDQRDSTEKRYDDHMKHLQIAQVPGGRLSIELTQTTSRRTDLTVGPSLDKTGPDRDLQLFSSR
jgi:hypothetical protein